MPRIWVFGSLNADLVIAAERPPHAGETLSGGDLAVYPGGKGANQAVAAAKLGGEVRMVGAVGTDSFGELLLESQTAAGVDVAGVRRMDRATGVALITVFPDGDNSILLSPGANGCWTSDEARDALRGIGSGDFLLCQLELPLAAVGAALKAGREAGATTILDPAPAGKLPREVLETVDILTPNETEAAVLGDDADAAGMIVYKRGAEGCVIAEPGRAELHVPAFAATAVDTTAAGDVFNGALAVALSEGGELEAAARFANAASSISVTRRGAQPSAPTRAEVESLLGR